MSAGRTYVVPGLAVVTVAADVTELLRGSIEFQLGHFVSLPGAAVPDGLAVIKVEPYQRFVAPAVTIRYQYWRAGPGVGRFPRAERHATRRRGEGFEVFSDSPVVLINLLLQTVALRQGRTLLHAAGWCDGAGDVTLLPGPGGVGKTALLAAAVQRHGARLLGDDLVLVGAGAAAAFPRDFVLKDYHRGLFPAAFATAGAARRNRDRWRPLVAFVRANAPFHGLFKSAFRRASRLEHASAWLQARSTVPEFLTVPVAELFGADRMAAGGPIRRVVYLERYDGAEFRHVPMDLVDAVQRSLAVLHHEWSDYLRWFCALGAVDLVDVGAHFRLTESALHAGLAGAALSRLQIPAGATPEELEEAFAAHVGFGARPA